MWRCLRAASHATALPALEGPSRGRRRTCKHGKRAVLTHLLCKRSDRKSSGCYQIKGRFFCIIIAVSSPRPPPQYCGLAMCVCACVRVCVCLCVCVCVWRSETDCLFYSVQRKSTFRDRTFYIPFVARIDPTALESSACALLTSRRLPQNLWHLVMNSSLRERVQQANPSVPVQPRVRRQRRVLGERGNAGSNTSYSCGYTRMCDACDDSAICRTDISQRWRSDAGKAGVSVSFPSDDTSRDSTSTGFSDAVPAVPLSLCLLFLSVSPPSVAFRWRHHCRTGQRCHRRIVRRTFLKFATRSSSLNTTTPERRSTKGAATAATSTPSIREACAASSKTVPGSSSTSLEAAARCRPTNGCERVIATAMLARNSQ